MKILKVVAILLCVVLLCAGCHAQVQYNEDTVLTYKLRDMDVQVQLTAEEAKMVAEILDGKSIDRWFDWDAWALRYYEYGCPFDQNVCIRIGDTVYYIAYDGCGTVRIGNNGEDPHIQLSYEEEKKILDLFCKYTGLENPY